MVDRSYTVWKTKTGILHRAEFGEVEVSQNDTVTFSGFDSSEDLLNAVFIKKSDGTQLTCTIDKNVATVTSAGTNMDCVYMVYGYKA